MKRSVIFVLICAMIMSVFPSYAAAAGESAEDIEEKIRLLYDLGLMEDVEEGNITRGFFAANAAKLTGMNKDGAQQVFDDVSREYKYFDDIYVAKMAGLISGMDNGMFSPNDNIQTSDAAEIMLRLLGYGDAAAVRIKLLRGVTASENGYLDVDGYKTLMSNALDCDVVIEDVWGEYSVGSGRTILDTYMGIYKMSGQITGCSYTALNGTSNLDDSEFAITVGKRELIMDSSLSREEIYNLLGRTVKLYYRKNDNSYEAVSIIPYSGRTLTVMAENINRAGSGRKLLSYYTESGSQRTARISQIAYVVYNRRALADVSDSDFRIKNGRIILCDSDSNGIYDVAIIEDCGYTLVQSVNTEEKFVIDKYGICNIKLDEEDSTFFDAETKAEMDLSELKENDLVESLKDKDGVVRSARRVEKRSVGKIDRISDEYVTIEGERIRLSNFYRELAASATAPKKFVRLKAGGTFCMLLNDEGTIVAAIDVSGNSGMQYGYMIEVAEEADLSAEIMIRMLNSDGKTVVLKANDKVTADGTTVKSGKLLKFLASAYGKTVSGGGGGKHIEIGAIVKYTLNEEGKISEIDTEKRNAEEEDSDSLEKNVDKLKTQWSTESSGFSGYALVNSQTKLFKVPVNISSNPDDYKLMTSGSMTSGAEYTFSAYDVARNGTAGAITVYVDGDVTSAIDGWAPVYMVDDVGEILNEEGNAEKVLYTYSLSGATELRILDGVDISKIKRGNLIRCGINFDGKVDNIVEIFNVDAKSEPTKSHTQFGVSYWFWFGEVLYTEGNVACVRMSEDGTEKRFFDLAQPFENRCHYAYDYEADKITTVKMAEILGSESFSNPSWILMYAWKGQVKDIFVYQNKK